MKVAVEWQGRAHPQEFGFTGRTSDGLVTEIGARSAEDGSKSAPSPKELVAMGIAGCTGIDLVSTLQKMRQPLAALRVGCDVAIATDHPKVFEACTITYEIDGVGLAPDRVIHAIRLSYEKYCGVSIMIKRSGCIFRPRLVLNGAEIPLPEMGGE